MPSVRVMALTLARIEFTVNSKPGAVPMAEISVPITGNARAIRENLEPRRGCEATRATANRPSARKLYKMV